MVPVHACLWPTYKRDELIQVLSVSILRGTYIASLQTAYKLAKILPVSAPCGLAMSRKHKIREQDKLYFDWGVVIPPKKVCFARYYSLADELWIQIP